MSVASYLKKNGAEQSLRVYTVNDESKYVIVRNVPAIHCIDELIKLFGQFGPIEEYKTLDIEEQEAFTEVCWIKFARISNARFAKKKFDEYNFFGNILNVSYAPEYESVSDTKEKLDERQHTVTNRLNSSKLKHPRPIPCDKVKPAVAMPRQQFNGFSSQISGGIDNSHFTSSESYKETSTSELSSNQYFPSSSMNATVQFVRENLDRISNMPLQSLTMKRQEMLDKDGSPDSNLGPATKKPKQDNRRRI